MAIDTRNKRFSVAGMIQPANPFMPAADGAIDAVGERLMLLKLFAGTASAAAALLVSNKSETRFVRAMSETRFKVPNSETRCGN